MSLTSAQREQTARELAANFELSRLSLEQLIVATGWPPQRLADTLAIRGADPADVWRLRDLLERYVIDAGGQPVAYTVLTEQARRAASEWFDLG